MTEKEIKGYVHPEEYTPSSNAYKAYNLNGDETYVSTQFNPYSTFSDSYVIECPKCKSKKTEFISTFVMKCENGHKWNKN